nr:MAG TPA: hypothetical protein [Caudoviricetes sp.]
MLNLRAPESGLITNRPHQGITQVHVFFTTV